MANDAYKVLADTSLARPLRTSERADGVIIQEKTGQAYAAGQYVFAEELTERDKERAENGDLDHLLEPADRKEAEEARTAVSTGLFIPEHEVERYALLDAGHRIIEKDQVLELRSAGAEAYAEALKASHAGSNDNPLITDQPSFAEVPDITTAVNAGENVVPGEGKQPEVSDYEVANAPSASVAGVEMPPGLPVGPTLAKAEGADASEVDEQSDKSQKKTKRVKPGSSSHSSSGSGSGGSNS